MPQVIRNYKNPDITKIKCLINRFNLLPPKMILSPLSVRSVDANKWQYLNSNIPIDQWTNKARESLKKNLKGLPKDFQNYICGDAKLEIYLSKKSTNVAFDLRKILDPPLQQVVERYENYKKLRKQFRKLVKFAFRHPSWVKQFEQSKRDEPTRQIIFMTKRFEMKKLANEYHLLQLPSSDLFKIDKKGILETEPDVFIEAIKGLDIRRIRKCEICKRIFWAMRVEKFCCSEKCNRTLNARLSRVANKTEQQKEKDNKAKRENRGYKSGQI